MFKILFKIMINLLATLIQIVVLPINALISATLPDISSRITQVTSAFGSLFNTMQWAIGIIPSSLLEVISFILLVEIAKNTIFRSTHMIIKVWNLFQKIKFW